MSFIDIFCAPIPADGNAIILWIAFTYMTYGIVHLAILACGSRHTKLIERVTTAAHIVAAMHIFFISMLYFKYFDYHNIH